MKTPPSSRFLLQAVALATLLLSITTHAALIHRWTFDDGTPNDSIGTAHGTNFNGANISGGRLNLDGVNDYFRTSPLSATISNRTLMAWVTLSNLTQQGGSALTIENPTGVDVFDGIIYGEAVTNRWINGSDSAARWQANPGIIASPIETSTEQVCIAIVYGDGAANNIKIYRNGVLYTDHTPASARVTYPAGVADVIIGVRHSDAIPSVGTATGSDPYLAGSINEARVYDTALTSSEIMQAQRLNLGQALSFNGVNQYVSVANFGSIIPTNEVTVEFWAYSTAIADNSAFVLNPDIFTNRFQSHLTWNDGRVYWDFGDISGNGRMTPFRPANALTNWIHYAMVASQIGNSMTIYTNGVLCATKAGMTPFVRGNYELRIGGGNYQGRLDDFRVWNTARSQAEIQGDFNQPLTGNETNLLVYYRFDSTSGNVATNSAVATGNAFNGTLINGPAWANPGFGVASLVVTNNLNSGPGSLRQIVGNAIPGNYIVFAPNLSGSSITLTNGQLLLNKNLTIDASALPSGVQVNGNNNSRIFQVASNATVVLNALGLANGNGAGAAATGSGGAIFNQGSLTLTNCLLNNNGSVILGGAITSTDPGSSVTAQRCTFNLNASGGNNGGGAIYATDSTLINLTECSFTGNVSPTTAGALHVTNNATGIVTRCTFESNSALDAGALRNSGGALLVTNSTLTVNTAQNNGGAILVNGGTTTLSHCTIARNGSPTGGGIRLLAGTLNMEYTLIATNFANVGLTVAGVDISQTGGSIVRGGPNLIGNNSSVAATFPAGTPNFNGDVVGTGASPVNALLAPIGNYGGPMRIMPPIIGSPAINAATNSTLATDQRGFPRPSGIAADIGAVESDYVPLVTTLVDGGAGSLRQTIVDSIPGGTVRFASNLSGSTILLTNGQLVLNKSLTLDGSTLPTDIRLNGNANGRVLLVTAGNNVVLDSLTITNGFRNDENGGGIFNSGTLTVNRCTITGNRVPNHGGGGIYNASTLFVNQSTFHGNQAAQGGGFRHAGILAVVNQSTFTANSDFAGGGGSIYNDTSSPLTVNQSTITKNHGGIWNDGPLNITNSIVADNPGFIGSPFGFNIRLAVTNVGVNLTNGIPLLAPLGNYGGRTLTMPPLPGSPALDAAVNSSFTNDQRGISLPLDGNGDSIAVADLGAVESQMLFVNTATDELTVPAGANLSLREALRDAATNSIVTFATNLSGSTILLTNSQLTVNRNLIIDATTLPRGIQINGNNATRIFQVVAGRTVTMNALTITNGNISGNNGAGIDNLGTLTLNRCTVAGNTTTGYGAGINNPSASGTLTLNQCTVAGNTCAAFGGAGIDVNAGTATVNQSTITGNNASNSSGAGGIWKNSGSTVTLFNSIVAGNTAPANTNIAGAVITTGTNITSVNPLLAPLGNYGGPTPTTPPLPGSPALEAINPLNMPFETDQRGLPRNVDANSDATPNSDIGAVELQLVEGHTPVLRATDFGQFTLRDAITALPPGTTITFAANLSGSNITLTSGSLVLNKNLAIDASALPGGITLVGNGSSRVIEITAGRVAVLSTLNIQGGVAPGGSYPNNSGGGILNRGTLTVTNCTLFNNQAMQSEASGGGAIENYLGNLTIHNSTIHQNYSRLVGGGIESYQGTLTLNQCTVFNNFAYDGSSAGGGIYSDSTALNVNQSTVVANTANIGGGIFCDGPTTIFNSIVATNNALSASNVSGAFTSAGVNLLSGDPKLNFPQNNGGFTETMMPKPGSPVLDAAPASGFAKDQRGFNRVVGAATDIGAVEAAFSPIILSTKLGSRPGNGLFQITFTNLSLSGYGFTVFASTNVSWPINAWSNLGPALETPPFSGQFKFSDSQSDNFPQRYYRIKMQ